MPKRTSTKASLRITVTGHGGEYPVEEIIDIDLAALWGQRYSHDYWILIQSRANSAVAAVTEKAADQCEAVRKIDA